MITLLREIQGVLNDRPLNSVDEESFEFITPSKLLLGRNLKPIPAILEIPNLDLSKSVRERLRVRLDVSQKFQNMWRRLYLINLQERESWKREKPNLKVGQLVMIEEMLKKRSDWPLARITEIRPGRDGLVRTVVLKTKQGQLLVRGINQLYPLEIE